MTASNECPGCGRPAGSSAWTCKSCGADIASLREDRRLAREFLRYMAIAGAGGVLLSVAIVIPLGAFAGSAPQVSAAILAMFAAAALGLRLAPGKSVPAPVPVDLRETGPRKPPR